MTTTTTTSLITGVDFVCIPTTDHDRACVFYGETLGLQRKQRWGDRPATEFQAGNLTLVVFDPRGFGQAAAAPSRVPIALHTEDVAATRAALEELGVTFMVDWMDSGVCHQAIFADPDGNMLILHHRYAPTPTP